MKLVILTGSSCCGKTTLTKQIETSTIKSLCLDNYFKDSKEIKKSLPIKFNGHMFGDWESLQSLNIQQFFKDIQLELNKKENEECTHLIVEGFALLELIDELQQKFEIDRICYMVGTPEQIVENRSKTKPFGYLQHIWQTHCERTLKFIQNWNETENHKRIPFTIIENRQWIPFEQQQQFETEKLDPLKLGIVEFKLPTSPFHEKQHELLSKLEHSNQLDDFKNRVLGMLFIHALGDAKGAPYELRGKAIPYSTDINNVICQLSRWQGKRYGVPGQATDDSAMTSLVLQALVVERKENWNKKEFEQKMIDLYSEWGCSSPSGLGKNTRKLFCHNLKTIGKRRERYLQHFNDPENNHEKNQSNGSLMRASPFAILDSLDEVLRLASIDTRLTNNNQVNEDSTRIYVTLLHHLLHDIKPTFNQVRNWASDLTEKVKKVIENALGKSPQWDLEKGKGWVLNSLWATFDAYRRLYERNGNMTPDEFIGSIYILKNPKTGKYLNTDSDTNAAIAGAVYGAWHGHLFLQEKYKSYTDDLKILLTARYDLSALKHGSGALQPFQYLECILKFENQNKKKRKTKMDEYVQSAPKQRKITASTLENK